MSTFRILCLATLIAASATAADTPLQPLEFLVGHCWAGEFPNNMGTDTHCFEAMYGGKFIRDKHVLHGQKGDYLGESIYAFDPRKKEIVFSYWSSDGDMESGSVIPAADGLNFPEHRLTRPQNLTMRIRWTHTGNRYVAVNEQRKGDGAWQVAWKVE